MPRVKLLKNNTYTYLLIGLVALLSACDQCGVAYWQPQLTNVTMSPAQAQVEDNSPLRFTVEHQRSRTGDPSLVINLRYKMSQRFSNGYIDFPQHIAPARIEEIELLTPGTRLLDTKDGQVKEIQHGGHHDVHLRYRIVLANNEQDVRSRTPVIRGNYVQAAAKTILAFPQSIGTKRLARIEWSAPSGWQIFSSFGEYTASHIEQNAQTIWEALFVAGENLRVHKTFANSDKLENRRALTVVVNGNFRFQDDAFIAIVTRIISSQRDFFQDYAYPNYLISLSESGRRGAKIGGTAHHNAFKVLLHTDTPLSNGETAHLLSHEVFHNWNGFVIKKAPKWFREGFTDYYGLTLAFRAGLIPRKKYVEIFNKWLWTYYASPLRNELSNRMEDMVDDDDELFDIPYQRGAIFAARLNAQIREKSNARHSLDNIMRDLVQAARTGDSAVTIEKINALAKLYGSGGDIAQEMAQLMDDGRDFTPHGQELGECYTLDPERVGTDFELGFALHPNSGVVTGVKRQSAAAQAGLRPSDVLSRYEFAQGAPHLKATVELAFNRRRISFFPVKLETTRDGFQFSENAAHWQNKPDFCEQSLIVW